MGTDKLIQRVAYYVIPPVEKTWNLMWRGQSVMAWALGWEQMLGKECGH